MKKIKCSLVSILDYKILGKFVQSGHINFLIGSGASIPAISLVGDIETTIDKQLKSNDNNEADITALEFIEKIEEESKYVSTNLKQKETLENYKKFLITVDYMLFERKNVLLPRQANIFTTNYDNFFERAISELPSIILNDGFKRHSGKGPFVFSSELFSDRVYRSSRVYETQSEIPTLNLMKMHGSLSWKRDGTNVFEYNSIPIKKLKDKTNALNVSKSLLKRAVILPNMRKFESTLLDRVYFDLLRLYSNALEKENALLFVFGFSFKDKHIFDITIRALRNSTAQIVIFAYNSEISKTFQNKFKDYQNVTIIHPERRTNIDFPRINKTLLDIVPKEGNSND